jgi:AraC family transcriptional regulator, regulatory protein of adaptative response / DNA-3-methyladenine glycosylase II
MRMTDAQMYSRLVAGDPTYNGRFFTGVLTTGIYCLPSCKARKPKAENVRFFPTCEAARAAGLRPCKKCHPDDFARGADPVLESMEALVNEVRQNPQNFSDVAAIVQRSGFGTTRVFELLRQHYHATPSDLLLHARLDAAKTLLREGKAALLEIAAEVGFESQSVFHDQFRRLNGLTPGSYRELRSARSFELSLPEEYPLAYLLRSLGRDPQSVTERLDGYRFETVACLGEKPVGLTLQFSEKLVHVNVSAPGQAAAAHEVVVGLLGLEQDAEAFSRLATRLGFARLVQGRQQLRLPQTTSVYEGLLWAVIGQQINLPFAFQLRRRLYEKTGQRVGETGLYATPSPAVVAKLKPEELLALQYSRQKAQYVIGISRRIVEGQLDLDALAGMSATRAERTLLAEHGLGPWSVNYLMMRSLGFADCVPLGDTGVTSGLQALFKLEQRPDADATRRLMSVFSPYRSLATAHLWQFNRPAP